MIDNHIKKYKLDNPNVTYLTLCKMFGVKIHVIMNIFDIRYYDYDGSLTIYHNGSDLINYRENVNGYWEKYYYNKYDNLIRLNNSNNHWKEWDFDDLNRQKFYRNHAGDSVKFVYQGDMQIAIPNK